MAEGVVVEDSKLSAEISQTAVVTADASDAAQSSPALVIIIGEPLGETHKQAVVNRIAIELQGWDVTASGCNLTEHLEIFSSQDPEVKAGTAGESFLRWKSDAALVEVLINPCVHSVETKLLEFAKADTSYRFVLYTGHAVAETGSWLLQDGALSFQAFVRLFSSACGGTGPIDVATYPEGEWSSGGGLGKCGKRLRLNPEKSALSDVAGMTKFASVLGSRIPVQAVAELLQGTDVIGVVPFNRPTVNIFQGGNGVSALFGVRGFSMLVDTGYPRRTCCWDFVRHMDHIDVVVLPHVGESNVMGAKSFVERLAIGDVRTAIGQVFLNAGQVSGAGKMAAGEAAAGDNVGNKSDSLLLSLSEVGVSVVDCLTKSHILRAPCMTKIPPQAINLYHKIGFGSLDLHVLNPVADSKDLKEFLSGWGKTAKSRSSRLNDLVSVSSVVVFRPETRGDRPVRILFPGSSPVVKLYEGLDRLKSNPLFQTLDGLEKPPVQKSSGDRGAPRPSTGAMGKPATARPASSSSAARDAHPAKTGTKVASRPGNTASADSKKTSAEASSAARVRDQKTPRDGKPAAKGDDASGKDGKAHPATSTPKKDGQKPAASKTDSSTVKAAPTARKTATTKLSASPTTEKTQSARHKPEKSATETKGKVPPSRATESAAHLRETAASAHTTAEVIPELVPCTTEHSADVSPVVSSQQAGDDNHVADGAQQKETATAEAGMDSSEKIITTEPVADNGGNNVPIDPSLSDSAQEKEPASVTAEADTDSSEKVTGPCVEPVADNGGNTVCTDPSVAVEPVDGQHVEPAVEFDPVKSWDAPQSLPAPSDDKVVGSMPPPAGKSAPRDRASMSGTGKRPAAASHPPTSARPASSAAKKPAPSRPTTPFYVDLAYVPTYAIDGCDAEFYRRVRARYYVVAGSSADPRQLSMLADAKSTWDGDVTVIPTGNTDGLIAWVMAHRDELASLKIEVSPSVARSTLQLDRGSVCSAYRLEF